MLDMFGPIVTVISAVLGFYVLQNATLRDGLTKFILVKLNKADVNKVDLKFHSILIVLKNYKNQLDFIFENELKSRFCSAYLGIMFTEIKDYLDKIRLAYDTLELDKTLSHTEKSKALSNILSLEYEQALSNMKQRFLSDLKCPDKVCNQFEVWRYAQLNAFRLDIQAVIDDDLITDNYYKVYTIYNKVSSFFNYVVANVRLLFANINGAFEKLSETDVFINPDLITINNVGIHRVS